MRCRLLPPHRSALLYDDRVNDRPTGEAEGDEIEGVEVALAAAKVKNSAALKAALARKRANDEPISEPPSGRSISFTLITARFAPAAVTVNSPEALRGLIACLRDDTGTLDAQIKLQGEGGTWHDGFRIVASQNRWWLMRSSQTGTLAFYCPADPGDQESNTWPEWAALNEGQVVTELLSLSAEPTRAGSN